LKKMLQTAHGESKETASAVISKAWMPFLEKRKPAGMGRSNCSPLRAVVQKKQRRPGARNMLGMSGICSPALAGRVRRGCRPERIPWGFASQNPQPKNGMDAVFRPRKG
jgi:hypothetical protein